MTAETKSTQQENNYNKALTGKEIEILSELAGGKSNKAIAISLNITINTVEKHLTAIYKKIDVKCRAEAILWWLQNGGVFRS